MTRRRAACRKLHRQRRYQQTLHGRSSFFLIPAVTSRVCISLQMSATREDIRPSRISTVFPPQDATTWDHAASPADKMSHRDVVSRCVPHSNVHRGSSVLCRITPLNLVLLSGGACCLDRQVEQQQEEEEKEHQILEERASLHQEREPSITQEEKPKLHLSRTQEETDECPIEVTESLSLHSAVFYVMWMECPAVRSITPPACRHGCHGTCAPAMQTTSGR